MKSFEHVLTFPKDSLDSGLFPTLPAKGLNKLSRTFKSAIVVHHGEQTCNVLRLLSLVCSTATVSPSPSRGRTKTRPRPPSRHFSRQICDPTPPMTCKKPTCDYATGRLFVFR